MGSYQDYKHDLISVIADLQRLESFCRELGLEGVAKDTGDLLTRLKRHSFSVAVVGEFKRGKSTFINALLGKEILPADIVPATATLNRVTYGLEPKARLYFEDGREDAVEVGDLAQYVTRLTLDAETRAKTIKEAVVAYPSYFCLNGVDIIDTPGLGDDEHLTRVTLSALPIIDAAIMVISAHAPFSETEQRFLVKDLLPQDLGKVIFVVNAIDQLNTPESADRLIEAVRERIANTVRQGDGEAHGKDREHFHFHKKVGAPRVFGISAYQALQSKQRNDLDLLNQSRFPAFEAALQKFLTEERGAILLQVPVNRVLTSGTAILESIATRAQILEAERIGSKEAYHALETELLTLQANNEQFVQPVKRKAKETRARVGELLSPLGERLRAAATGVIDATPMTPEELTDMARVEAKLNSRIVEAVEVANHRIEHDVVTTLQQALSEEEERLKEFRQAIYQLVHRIEGHFGDIAADEAYQDKAQQRAETDLDSMAAGLHEIWFRYDGLDPQQPGRDSAEQWSEAMNTVTSKTFQGLGRISTGSGTDKLAGFLSKNMGGEIADKVRIGLQSFGQSVVKTQKAAYKARVLRAIERQLQASQIENKVDRFVNDTFQSLKRRFEAETKLLLAAIQQAFAELRGKWERQKALNDRQRAELDKMRTETERSVNNAQRLSTELDAILGV